MTVAKFTCPFKMLKYMTILIPIYAHTMIFNLSAAMLTVEIPSAIRTPVRIERSTDRIAVCRHRCWGNRRRGV